MTPGDVFSGRAVALTGATGFVGHHVACRLHALGARVRALVRSTSRREALAAAGVPCRVVSLDDADDVARACEGCEIVFHLAGAVGFETVWEPHLRVNVGGTRGVLRAARKAGVRRVVHTSSIVAVGASASPRVLDETATWNLGPHRVPYVTTKRQAEELALAENGAALEVVVVNPASVVGPADPSGSEFGTLCRRFWKRRIPFYFGGGNNFVDVRDVAQGHLLAAVRGRPGERYLLAGKNRTYGEFFTELCRAAGQFLPRLQLPVWLAPLLGRLQGVLARPSRRPYLSPAQAALMGLYFYFDSAKACRELGYDSRPLHQSLGDAHDFWMGDPSLRSLRWNLLPTPGAAAKSA